LRDEAANEIDRLREELKHLRKQFLDAEDVEAERDRLREALKAIIEEDRHWTESGAEIARAALAKEAGQS
jgi:cell shape-determining protein MreC